ncbi:MAG: threonine--tRNA ligase [Melioribacteraceae bacterium]|nr:threonine--tRNA ligase [Melioribacteraceae bacterium]
MENIKITFPDSSVKEFSKGITAFEVAESISKKLAEFVLVAKVNGKTVDLNAPINEDAAIQLFKFEDNEGREAYWHSTAHLMAHAIQTVFPEAKFGVGPAIETGFYYDIDINSQLTDEHLEKLEKKMLELANEDKLFVRKEVSRNEAVEFFKAKGDQYKLEILEDIITEDAVISIYEEGAFTDLCSGPHIPSVGKIKFVKLLNVSGSYWRGDEKNKQLQRIYGISFPKKKQLDEHLRLLEEAKKRDHRKLGKALDLFSIHEDAGPGLIYWHPKGARIRHIIEDFWKKAHFDGGYDMLYTPHIGKKALWETSGHLGFYKESMFAAMSIDDMDYYAKPMNCPFHIKIYQTQLRSYRDLPLRWAELGTVYRYEKSGVLHGLLRVRGFTQDDAHIFCTHEQIEDEIIEVIRFSNSIWKTFGFEDLKYYVSTRPEKAVGENELWDKATKSLENALEKEGLNYEVDEGGGAFYGPKIDIKIKDALHREWQMSTIQFDFNLPERFDMEYVGEDGKTHRPFMVHRALLGSIERFMGVIIEHYGGSFPSWLAPLQVAVVPVSQNHIEYAEKVEKELKESDIRIVLDKRNEKIGYKIRDWETQKVPYMLIVGDKEIEAEAVSVRQHKKGDQGTKSVAEFKTQILDEVKNRINNI